MPLSGFQNYPQRPSPNRRQVGEALLMQQMGGAQPGMQPGLETGAAPIGDPGTGEPSVGDPAEHGLRMQGGHYMGGAGQTGWGSGTPAPGAEEDPNPSAIAAAVGEALTRQGGGLARDANPYIDRERRKRDVLRLGLSQFEVELLGNSGGL